MLALFPSSRVTTQPSLLGPLVRGLRLALTNVPKKLRCVISPDDGSRGSFLHFVFLLLVIG
jgi:hypothetical protein